ncbi:MAG: hypothetical protein H6696_19920 [Deferribacteres bacterium]|nr:hypothetical protein [candidate division KSB1 bacterium]MCB9504198.1 hypothetical protein [Deferribacteres bacterium]
MQIDRTGLGSRNNNISAYKINEPQHENEKSVQDKTTVKGNADSVQISAEARKLFEAQNVEKNAPGDNTLKNALIKSNTAESPEQADRISGKVGEKMAANDVEKQKQLDLVRKRLNENYYSSPEVINKIADGLMRDLNIKE